MPERIVTESDDVEIDVGGPQLVIVVVIITGVGRTVCMNDDLRVRAFLAHCIAAGVKQSEITRPVVAALIVRMHLDVA